MGPLAPAVIAFLGVLIGAAIAFLGELIKIEERRKERILFAWQEWFSASDEIIAAEHDSLQYVLFGNRMFTTPDAAAPFLHQAKERLQRCQRRENAAFALVMLVDEKSDLVIEAQDIRQRKPIVELQPRVNRHDPPDDIHREFMEMEESIARQRGLLAVRVGDRARPFWARNPRKKRKQSG